MLIILRQQDEAVTVATLGSLMNAWAEQDHLVRILGDLHAAGLITQRGAGWMAVDA